MINKIKVNGFLYDFSANKWYKITAINENTVTVVQINILESGRIKYTKNIKTFKEKELNKMLFSEY